MKDWKVSPLKDIAYIDRNIVEPAAIKSGTIYVGLENIKSGGDFVDIKTTQNGDLSSSKFSFTPQHLLYGKLRPYLAKIARPSFEGICSTDILPILPGPQINRDFLFHFLLQPIMVAKANSLTTGANLPRLNPKTLSELEIPFPPVEEQKRIADILDKADAIRRKRQQAIKLADEFLRATFLDMFGDPVVNPKGWKMVYIGDITKDWKGGAALEPNDFTYEGFPILHKGAIHPNGVILIDTGKKTHTTKEYASSHSNSVIDKNYVAVTLRDLVPTGPSIGLIADLAQNPEREYLLAQGAYGFKVLPSKIKPSYLVALSNNRGFRSELKRYWVGSTQIHIRTPVFKEIPIPLPEYAQQKIFDDVVKKVSKLKKRKKFQADIADSLFCSLRQRAFRGEI
jgi:type I restriction enzyme, S subunit